MESLIQPTSSPTEPQLVPHSVTQSTPQQIPQGMPANTGMDLKDIHLPEQINDFPIAMGWWLLATIIILTIIYFIVKYRSHLNVRLNQKKAIAQIMLEPTIDESIKILKWAAIQYFPRQQLAKLYGEKFQQFLLTHLTLSQQEKFKFLSSPAFESLYKNSKNNEQAVNKQLNQAAILWLKNALPPKKSLTHKTKELTND